MSGWTVAWLVWGAAFVVIEAAALWHDRKGSTVDTLSQHVWNWFAVGRPAHGERLVKTRRLVLLTFMVWLSVHFLSGGWV